MRITATFLAIAALAMPCMAQAGDVAGIVYDNRGNVAAGVEVSLAGQDRTATTGEDGAFAFDGLEAGEHQLAVKLQGGNTQRVWLEVAATGETRRNIFLMSPAALERALDMNLQTDSAQQRALQDTLELAERMASEGAEREAAHWRWRDLDA